ncbi:MAG: peptidylprolyl isomerase [Pseudomonadota bacterium]
MLNSVKLSLFSMVLALAPALQADAQAEGNEIAQTDASEILATVNGTVITLGHVIALRQGLPAQYNQFPAEFLMQAILEQLIQHELLLQSASDEPSFKTQIQIENETRTLIAIERLAEMNAQAPTQSDLLTLYDAEYPPDMDAIEYRASHILVETEEEAIRLITSLASGADFAELAREFSTGPSGAEGGDLGWFSEGDMVEPFFEAVEVLTPGGVSPPVQTQFGYHVIRLSETRQQERPALETVQPELEELFRQSRVDDAVAELQDAAEITRTDLGTLDASLITQYDLLEP